MSPSCSQTARGWDMATRPSTKLDEPGTRRRCAGARAAARASPGDEPGGCTRGAPCSCIQGWRVATSGGEAKASLLRRGVGGTCSDQLRCPSGFAHDGIRECPRWGQELPAPPGCSPRWALRSWRERQGGAGRQTFGTRSPKDPRHAPRSATYPNPDRRSENEATGGKTTSHRPGTPAPPRGGAASRPCSGGFTSNVNPGPAHSGCSSPAVHTAHLILNRVPRS